MEEQVFQLWYIQTLDTNMQTFTTSCILFTLDDTLWSSLSYSLITPSLPRSLSAHLHVIFLWISWLKYHEQQRCQANGRNSDSQGDDDANEDGEILNYVTVTVSNQKGTVWIAVNHILFLYLVILQFRL